MVFFFFRQHGKIYFVSPIASTSLISKNPNIRDMLESQVISHVNSTRLEFEFAPEKSIIEILGPM